jgi:hypothetical protein
MSFIGGEMLRTIEGVYRNGRVELVEVPEDVLDGSRAIVTFVKPSEVDPTVQDISSEPLAPDLELSAWTRSLVKGKPLNPKLMVDDREAYLDYLEQKYQ